MLPGGFRSTSVFLLCYVETLVRFKSVGYVVHAKLKLP